MCNWMSTLQILQIKAQRPVLSGFISSYVYIYVKIYANAISRLSRENN